TEYASGKAASSPAPPSTSQVSLPSHTGATVFIITSRSAVCWKKGNRMPIPRSKPSITTYIMTPNRMMTAQINGRSTPMSRLLCCGGKRPHRLARPARTARPRVVAGLLRAGGQQAHAIGSAGAEHGKVDDHEKGQRKTHLAGGVRRYGVGGALQPVHDPRLAADFRGVPARQQGNQPRRRHGQRKAQEWPGHVHARR